MRRPLTTTLLLPAVVVLDIVIVALAIGVINVDPDAASAGARSHVKVAIIVGPVGRLTDYYRTLANEAAAVARSRADRVVTVYSPDATWPAARAAMNGASIVVYLGHGNGWPSPYREKLYRPTQNGLGLNPVAGVDDDAHQYFGERDVARVDLAPGAVVVLGHLCYASGNPEPGGPEPTLDVARQRVDNYAAGWLAAGASGVIAEGHGRPAFYVKRLLRGTGSLERLWRSAPTFHDHVIAYESARTPGATVMLDPDGAKRGFFRSITLQEGVRVEEAMRSGSTKGSARAKSASDPSGAVGGDATESLAARGARFGTPEFVGAPVAATEAGLTIPLDAATQRLLPEQIVVGTRWDPVAPDGTDDALAPSETGPAAVAGAEGAVPTVEATTTDSPGGAVVPVSSLDPTAVPSSDIDVAVASPATEPDTTGSTLEPAPGRSADGGSAADRGSASEPIGEPAVPEEPATIELIGPETPGKVVVTHPSIRSDDGLSIPVDVPTQPGVYRLVTTLHDGDGVAFEAETQDLIPALIVRVTGEVWASYAVPETMEVEPGKVVTMHVGLANSGTRAWSGDGLETGVAPEAVRAPLLVGRWVGLDDVTTYGMFAGPTAIVQAFVSPGDAHVIAVPVRAPSLPGRYLLVFDILDARGSSLASMGVPPGLTRVVVMAGAASNRDSTRSGSNH